MPVLPFLIFALCVLAIGYRYYSAFIAAKVLALDAKRQTPAYSKYDRQHYYPTSKFVLFGHHFAAITGAGPLIGPVLAAQFGFLPGFLWLVVGVVLGGAVHDFVILSASIRHDGKSLSEIAKSLMGPLAGFITSLAVLFIVIIALAGLGVAFVNALAESAWGAFIVATSIPLALVMGLYMYKFHDGNAQAIKKASIFGILVLLTCVVVGKNVPESSLGSFFILSKTQITIAVALYGFIASVLPVWLLLCPRDYLSSYLKLGTISLLVLAVFFVQPDLKMPLVSVFANGGGPIIPGKLFPFVFITIACGAISGFHSLIASGTTPKMIENETHARPIGYGAMLLEGLVGIVALIATASLYPEDYFAINVATSKFSQLGMTPVHLSQLERAVGEQVAGRPGGAVSLALGMAQIFSELPLMKHLLSYWYHFAIMFEALFILTTIDAGTRVASLLTQEFFKNAGIFKNTNSNVMNFLSSALVVFAWSYFILTGNISTIWPMFGVANQLLACIALCVGTTYILKLNGKKPHYALVTLVPLVFVSFTTVYAAISNITNQYWPMIKQSGSAAFQGYLVSTITFGMLICTFIILFKSLKIWKRYL